MRFVIARTGRTPPDFRMAESSVAFLQRAGTRLLFSAHARVCGEFRRPQFSWMLSAHSIQFCS